MGVSNRHAPKFLPKKFVIILLLKCAINVGSPMYTYTMNKKEMKYCVGCGFVMDMPEYDLLSMCYGCTTFSTKSIDFLSTYVPAVCGDDVCYYNNGEMNLDGETCSHYEDFYAVFDNY